MADSVENRIPLKKTLSAPITRIDENDQECPPQRDLHPPPPRRASSTTSTLWSETIRKVLRGKDDQIFEEDDSEPDLVGEQITRLLNASPEFKRPSLEEANKEEQDQDEMTFYPVFSSRNIQRFYIWLKDARPPHPGALAAATKARCFAAWKYVFRDKPSIGRAVRLFVFLLMGSLALLVTTSYVTIMWLLRVFVVGGPWLLSFFVDLEEIKSCCPSALKSPWNLVVRVGEWIDDNVLFRKKIAGREWNADSFVWRGMDAESRRETLWNCPPPSAKLGLLNSSQIQRHDWSAGTLQHITAVEFCHDMLEKEKLRKQISQRRKALKRSASERSGIKTTNKRSEFASQYRNKSDHSIPFPKLTSTRLSPIKQEPNHRDFFSDNENQLGELNGTDDHPVLSTCNRSDVENSSRESSPLRKRRSYSDSEIGSSSYLDTDTDNDGDNSLSSMNSGELFMRKNTNCESSVASMTGQDMNWLDVGTRIGMRLLNSEHVQKAIASQDTAERILDISSKIAPPEDRNREGNDSFLDFNMENLAALGANPLLEKKTDPASSFDAKQLITPQRPVHSMWTNPTSAGASVSSISDVEDASLGSDIPSPPLQNRKHFTENGVFLPDAGFRAIDVTVSRDKEIKRGKCAKDHRSDKVKQLKRPKERRDETEIVFKCNLSLKTDSPRVSESVELTLGRKRADSPKDSMATMLSPMYPMHRPPCSRPTLVAGMKMVVPIFPLQPTSSSATRTTKHKRTRTTQSHLQMATVVSSKRIFVRDLGSPNRRRHTNCLSVTVKLDKSFLRNGEFAEMTFRVMDEWGDRFMPKHSKFPIGACVATSFGLGVLVGWRVEDDIHVVRSLWQHKGPGRAHAYLNRDSIHGVAEASVGLDVDTRLGSGTVLAYVNGGTNFRSGRYFVLLKEEGRHKGNVLEFNRTDILACQGSEFIPIIEYIREAAQYQLQVDNYEAAVRKQKIELSDKPSKEDHLWRTWSKGFETMWASFLKAIEEDSDFDVGISAFVSSIIDFLERLDSPETQSEVGQSSFEDKTNSLPDAVSSNDDVSTENLTTMSSDDDQTKGFWILDDMFGIFQLPCKKKSRGGQEDEVTSLNTSVVTDGTINTYDSFGVASAGSEVSASDSYRRAFAAIRIMMRTVAMARASSADQPNFRLALSTCYEFLLFVRTVIKVQQKNVSPASVAAWKRTIAEIVATFGPVKERMEKIGRGIAERMEHQGNRAKVRILRFVDIVLVDEQLLAALEEGAWDQCMARLERALVKARVIDPDSRDHYHKCLMFICDHLVPETNSDGAAARNNEKLAHLAKAVKWMASPRRSLLSLLKRDDVLEIVERILVRVFRKEREISRMLCIHASNFHSFRHLRMLKDFTISGKLWTQLLNAADEEFAWAVSSMPDNAKDYMCPLSKLFSLGVAQFRRISAGDLTTDWLDFLLEEDAVKLIHEIDMKLILGLESFCHDVKAVMVVLPYYPSIDDDILNLMDEVDIEEILKEASEAMDDPDGLAAFFKEKATIAIERFLDYLPKMSIPVERRELGEGWVLTCRGENGGDLKLSDVSVKKENMVCQITGSDNVFFPMFGDEMSSVASTFESNSGMGKEESSILDHIRELLLSAQSHGCWKAGVGGVGQPPSDRYVNTALNGLPVSSVLNCGIELWRNLEIDDDELLEIAIRDVSYQIQLQQKCEHGLTRIPLALQEGASHQKQELCDVPVASLDETMPAQPSRRTDPLQFPFGRFNPRRDPTVLYLEMNKLTFHLEKFMFRIEKMERKTIFDPVFDGFGSLSVRNVSIKLRVECRKARINKLGSQVTVPILYLQELDVQLAMVKFKVKDTGADWFLNKVVHGFSDNISRIVETNLKEQVSEQVRTALQNLNSYFAVNPDLMLSLLGITMDDLEEHVVWV